MTRTARTGNDGAVALAALHGSVLRDSDVKPEDINADWLDDMVKRLFAELSRQLEQVEKSPAPEGVKGETQRATNARTLASLERTLERLSKLELQRAESREEKKREKKVQKKHGGARQKLEQRLDRLVAAHTSFSGPQPSDG